MSELSDLKKVLEEINVSIRVSNLIAAAARNGGDIDAAVNDLQAARKVVLAKRDEPVVDVEDTEVYKSCSERAGL